jgi:RNA polymerase sigma-70 factor (ECF subfamily)
MNDGLDRELIKRLKKNDETAFKLLCEKFHDTIWRATFLIVKDDLALEDVIHETKLQIWKSRNSLKEDSIQNYIFTIARNKAIDYVKSRKRRLNTERIYTDRQEDVVINDELERKELKESIKMMIQKVLSAPFRTVYMMSYLDEKKNKEIAKELELQEQVVKNTLSKARKIVREALKDLLS